LSSRPFIEYVQGENPWITYFRKQVFIRNNCINSIAVGKPGTGKSWGVLSLVSQLDPDFSFEGNWYFNVGQFMKAAKDYYKEKQKKTKGKIWVLDEAGVDLNNLSHFDQLNRSMNIFFQTARHRNYLFFGTVPFLSFISKGVRKLTTSILRCEGWNSDNKTIFLPRILEYNDELDKFYKKRLLIKTESGLQICNKILVKKPPVRLRRNYEKLKMEFTTDLYDIESEKISAFEEKQEKKWFGTKPTRLQEEVLQKIKEGKTMLQTAKLLRKPIGVVGGAMELLRQKGYEFEETSPLKYKVIELRKKRFKYSSSRE
jgi:hypothetical protein